MSTLSPEVEAALDRYAAALPMCDRAAFVAEVVAELANVTEVGLGVLARVVRQAQPKFIDQAVVGSGPRPALSRSKYSRPNWSIERGRLRAGAPE